MKKSTTPLYEKRGITFQELGALLGTREMLVRKILSGQGERIFDMGTYCSHRECGTASCIGGTMAIIMNEVPGDYGQNTKSQPLHILFHPPKAYVWPSVTAKQSIAAIDNWLKTGNPKWEKILKRSQLGPDVD